MSRSHSVGRFPDVPSSMHLSTMAQCCVHSLVVVGARCVGMSHVQP